MDLWRIAIETTSEAADAVSALLSECGAIAVDMEDQADLLQSSASPYGESVGDALFAQIPEGARVHGYLSCEDTDEQGLAAFVKHVRDQLQRVRASGLQTGSLSMTTDFVPADSYLHAWKAYYHTMQVTDRLTIVPSWERAEHVLRPDEIAIWMEPGMSFGTGTHETTLLCLRALAREWEAREQDRPAVLDVGTGTGILAIAAAKMGASKVVAIELDPVAVRVAQDNIIANDVAEQVDIRLSDLADAVDTQETFAVVTANLLADLVIRLLPQVVPHVTVGGCLIASGIIEGQSARVQEEMTRAGFVRLRVDQDGDWVAITGYKES